MCCQKCVCVDGNVYVLPEVCRCCWKCACVAGSVSVLPEVCMCCRKCVGVAGSVYVLPEVSVSVLMEVCTPCYISSQNFFGWIFYWFNQVKPTSNQTINLLNKQIYGSLSWFKTGLNLV